MRRSNKRRQVIVETYKTRRRMQRRMNKMLVDGYLIEQQSGSLPRLLTGPLSPARGLTVTYRLVDEDD